MGAEQQLPGLCYKLRRGRNQYPEEGWGSALFPHFSDQQVAAGVISQQVQFSISRGGLGISFIPSLLRSTSSSGRHLTTSSVLSRKMVSKLSTEERSAQLQPLLAKGQ